MGKTTNILDLNNRLTKIEKENVAQNSYTSLKNKPKINNVTLTGNKTLADIGAAAAADVGDIKGRSGLSINFADLIEYGNGIFSISTTDDTDAPDSNGNSYYVLQSSFYSDNSYVIQIAINSWPTDFKVYLRKRTSGTWSNWKSIEFI